MQIEQAIEEISRLIESVDDWGYEALRDATAASSSPEVVKRAKHFGSAKRGLEKAREHLRKAEDMNASEGENYG